MRSVPPRGSWWIDLLDTSCEYSSRLQSLDNHKVGAASFSIDPPATARWYDFMTMKRSRRILLIVAAAVLILTAVAFLLGRYCPAQGIAFTRARREFQLLKNRTVLPQQTDFDSRVTLESLLQPGDDRLRWSHSRAARVEGYVVSVASARPEMANCYSPCARDIHINLALRLDAPLSAQVVAEITPRVQAWAKGQGHDWTEQTLRRELIGRWCSLEGWLLFDQSHDEESENAAPGRAGNWRATAWEIHPVTALRVIR